MRTGPGRQPNSRTAQTHATSLGPDPAKEHPPWEHRKKKALLWNCLPGVHDPGRVGLGRRQREQDVYCHCRRW